MNSTVKTLILWMVIFVVVILLWNTIQAGNVGRHELTFTEFIEEVDSGRISEVTIAGQKVNGKFRSGGKYPEGETFLSYLPPDYTDELVRELRSSNVIITAEEPRENPLIQFLVFWAPILLIIGLWIFFMRQMQSGGNKALSFGKSKAKLMNTAARRSPSRTSPASRRPRTSSRRSSSSSRSRRSSRSSAARSPRACC